MAAVGHFHALEKEMATHSSVLAGRIPGMGEPGGLPSMGSHRVGHDGSGSAAAAAAEQSFSNSRLHQNHTESLLKQTARLQLQSFKFRKSEVSPENLHF